MSVKVTPFYFNDEDDLFANTYIVADEHNNCLVIDPGKDYPGFSSFIKKNNYSLKGVLLTHGHFDHIRGVDRLVEEFKCPLFIGFYDQEALKNSRFNCSRMLREEIIINSPSSTVADKEVLRLLEEEIVVIETPFHTCGSVCYYLKDSKILFSGDTLFRLIVGRTDLPTSEPTKMKASLAKLMELPDDVLVYPGHNKTTTIGEERKLNHFINR